MPDDPDLRKRARRIALEVDRLYSKNKRHFHSQIEAYKPEAAERERRQKQDAETERRAVDDIWEELQAIQAGKARPRLTDRDHSPGPDWRWGGGHPTKGDQETPVMGWVPVEVFERWASPKSWPGPNPSTAVMFTLLAALHDECLPDSPQILPVASGKPLEAVSDPTRGSLYLLGARFWCIEARRDDAQRMDTLESYLAHVKTYLDEMRESEHAARQARKGNLVAGLFSKLAPDARTPQELGEAISRALESFYTPSPNDLRGLKALKRANIEIPAVDESAWKIARRLKKDNPALPPLPPIEEESPHRNLLNLAQWCKSTGKADAGSAAEIVTLCDKILTLARAERPGGAPPPVGEYASMSGPSGMLGRMGLAYDDEWDRLAKQFDGLARRIAQLVKALAPTYQTGTFYVAGPPKPLADFYPESAFNLPPSERKELLEHVRRLNPDMDEARVAEVVKGIDELSASHARNQFTKPQWPGFVLQLQDREGKLHLHFVSPPQMVHAFEQRFEVVKAWVKEHPQVKTPKGAEAGAGAPASGTAPKNTWQVVRERLLTLFRRGEQYISLRELATRLNCAPGTVKKALTSDRALQSWSQPASRPKGQALNEVVTDNAASNREGNPADVLPQADVDAIMQRLIGDEKMRPGIRSKLKTMNSEQCRTVASWYNRLPEDAHPAEMVATYLSQQQDCHAEATNAKGPKIGRRKV